MSEDPRLLNSSPTVYVCHSRDDSEFVQKLTSALLDKNINVTYDLHSIAAAEDWERRNREMIAKSDQIIFVLSPRCIESTYCQWQVGEAKRQGKRIIPVLYKPVDQFKLPDYISSLNYIVFKERLDGTSEFIERVEHLILALNTDLGWIKQQTHLMHLTRLWFAHNKDEDYLIRSRPLREAESWVSNRPRDVRSPPTDIMEFLAASRKSEQNSSDAASRSRHFGATQRPNPRPRGTKVFISYRRSDTRHLAGRIDERLRSELSDDQIFFDIDSIPLGLDFRDQIVTALNETAVILALIGERWINPDWRKSGSRWFGLVKSRQDFIQVEMELGLDMGIPIIPVLVDGVFMPEDRFLPATMREFVALQAAQVRSGREFLSDMSTIVRQIQTFRAQGQIVA